MESGDEDPQFAPRLLVKVVALESEVALLEVLKKCFVDSQAKVFQLGQVT